MPKGPLKDCKRKYNIDMERRSSAVVPRVGTGESGLDESVIWKV